ncbi:MAG TPA: ABC transporter ATP-binding protein [Candidatus Limnocylindria bacterium]|nr:ABC transporter ATP-binding protein [Candidatus Limnocylindria bacterium]
MSELVARDLWVTPPGAGEPIVRGASLSVRSGEWVAVAGPNGGGKTTLLLATAGLWPIARGTLELDGRPLRAGGARSRIAVVLQDPSSQLLQPTVMEELAFASRNLGRPEPELEASVHRVALAFGLESDLERDPASLSAGRQQLVLLAAALAAGPDLLIADEPTAHLDDAARVLVMERVSAELENGLGVLWATQDPAERAAAHRIVRIGDLPELGPPELRDETRVDTGTVVALTIRIACHSGANGRRVMVREPQEIAVASRGITALIGPNGAGKSVVIGAVAGLEPLDQVDVEWEIDSHPPPIVALQYPELQIFEEEVADEIVFAACSRGVRAEEARAGAAEMLARLGFNAASFMNRRTWTLSTGEKRLVEIIGALISPASLVALDEPTAGLDPERRMGVAALVRERSARSPVLVATQDRAWAIASGARLAIIGERDSTLPSHRKKTD